MGYSQGNGWTGSSLIDRFVAESQLIAHIKRIELT
jgi:hypothetical protein